MPTGDARAEFSVVVPTHRRPTALARCLDSLAAVAYPTDAYEVIVVADGGEVDRGAWGASTPSVRVVTQAQAGPAAARNRGAGIASKRFLAFVDDDCVVDPEWLAAFAAALRGRPDVVAAGRVVNALPRNLFAVATQTMIDYVSARATFVTSNNFAVDRAAFLDLGGFDERFTLAAGEDRDFSRRWLATDREIVAVPGAVVHHEHDLSLTGFVRQHYNYGRGAYELRHGGTSRQRPSFYLGLVTRPLRTGRRRPTLAAVLALSQAATAAGFARAAVSTRRRTRLRWGA